MSIEIIAEIGVNHNGEVRKARELIRVAAVSGANTVKTQAFIAEELVSADAPKAPYQQQGTSDSASQLEMLKQLEISVPNQIRLRDHALGLGMEFLSTPFEMTSLKSLLHALHMKRIKVASSDIVSIPLLHEIGKHDVDVILSTGFTEGEEISIGLGALAVGALGLPLATATPDMCIKICHSQDGLDYRTSKVTLLHCTSAYPAPLPEVNLRQIESLRSAYRTEVGFSDHTQGSVAAIAAVALEVTIIEKHLTLDKRDVGPDHLASLDGSEFSDFVKQIRAAESALGSAHRTRTAGEIMNLTAARKRIVARSSISKGNLFTTDNLTIQRPSTGIPARDFALFLGQRASRNYSPGDPIDE